MEIHPWTTSIFLQIPQYFIITTGEVLFSVTGLAFAYSQVMFVSCRHSSIYSSILVVVIVVIVVMGVVVIVAVVVVVVVVLVFVVVDVVVIIVEVTVTVIVASSCRSISSSSSRISKPNSSEATVAGRKIMPFVICLIQLFLRFFFHCITVR